MLATMQAANGVGIAAPQVYMSLRIIIIASKPNPRYPDAPDMTPEIMFNPEIIWQSAENCVGRLGRLLKRRGLARPGQSGASVNRALSRPTRAIPRTPLQRICRANCATRIRPFRRHVIPRTFD